MSQTKFMVKQGFVHKVKGTPGPNWVGGFDLNRFFKWASEKYNIPYVDDCCVEELEQTTFPLRANTAGDNTLEYHNGTAWVAFPFDVSAADITATTVTSPAIATDSITEATANENITLEKNIIQRRDAAAINTTATATAAQIAGGLITSTSAAAVALTLPTATDLATEIAAVQGTSVDFIVDNSAGSNTVTVTVNTGITAVTAVITGGATLTVASGATGQFRIYFTSATVAKIARIY